MKPLHALLLSALATGLAVAAPAPSAPAHDAPDPVGEAWHVHERLLVSDSRTGDIVVVDDGRVRDRISTPAYPPPAGRDA